MLGTDTYQKYLERGNIEVAPLAYMRGRTLDDSFIILDEAQNTSREQMKMFLTRIGFGSKVVITGDITQIDLPEDKTSGLKVAMKVLDGIEDIAICQLTRVWRCPPPCSEKIIEAYEVYDKKNPAVLCKKLPRKKEFRGAEPEHGARKFNVETRVTSLSHNESAGYIKKAVNMALDAEGVDVPCIVSVMLTDDDGIHAVNKEFRDVDRATDVLSFPQNELEPGHFDAEMWAVTRRRGHVLLGDMMISVPRCEAQGEEFGHGYKRELMYLTMHSILHLLGYDHVDEGEMKKQMRAHEKFIMGDDMDQ